MWKTAIVTLALALAACGKTPTAAEEEDAAPAAAPPRGEVAVLDSFGPFSAPVADIAFWAHPTLPFNGMALVATADGVVALNIEDGAEVARISGMSARGVAVFYHNLFAPDTEERSGDLTGVAAVLHGSGKLGFFQIDDASRQFAEIEATGFSDARGDVFCAAPTRGEEPGALVVIGGDRLARFHVLARDGVLEAADPEEVTLPGAAAACAFAPSGDELFVLLRNGRIFRRADSDEGFKPFATTTAKAAISLKADVASRGRLLVLDGADASVHLIDARDGKIVGVARLKASFDFEGVDAATAMGVGSGNFGGAYRDGVLALATAGDAPSLRLAPLAAASRALGAPVAETRSPRSEGIQADDEEAGCAPSADGSGVVCDFPAPKISVAPPIQP